MAHKCWALDEIVRTIVANLVADRARASAVALASCSKSIEEAALKEVWRNPPNLAPLVKCFLPEAALGLDRNLASITMHSMLSI